MSVKDQEIEKTIQTLLDEAEIPVAIVVDNGIARLIGRVSSPRLRQAAIDIASTSRDIKSVEDEMNYEVVSPDMVSEPDNDDDDEEFGYADEQSLEDDVPDEEMGFQLNEEPRDDSTLNFDEEVEDEETYFPPTDPVVGPSRYGGDLEVVGGFQTESTDDTDEEEGEAYDDAIALDDGDRVILRDDEDILDDVIRELREDALTTDLKLTVHVRRGIVILRGTVQTLDDAENAQEVASRVAGVIDVDDRTDTEEG
jgi:osmotically-inducible protein OsmY